MSRWIDFISGFGTDHKGRYLLDIVYNRNDDWWESNHDHIQWLFPNYSPSQYNPHAPILSIDDITQAHYYKDNIKLAFDRFMRFLGLEVVNYFGIYVKVRIISEPSFNSKVFGENHNLLRITRVLKFIKATKVLTKEGKALQRFLLRNAKVNSTSLRIWKNC